MKHKLVPAVRWTEGAEVKDPDGGYTDLQAAVKEKRWLEANMLAERASEREVCMVCSPRTPTPGATIIQLLALLDPFLSLAPQMSLHWFRVDFLPRPKGDPGGN